MAWQSIDTAPRDGTLILGRDDVGTQLHCSWWTRARISEHEGGKPEDWDSAWIYEDTDDWGTFEPVVWQSIV